MSGLQFRIEAAAHFPASRMPVRVAKMRRDQDLVLLSASTIGQQHEDGSAPGIGQGRHCPSSHLGKSIGR